MRFRRVCLESFGYCLPEEIISSEELEHRLTPLYERLRLPEGRLELITGIEQRRIWPAGMLPSEKSIESARLAMEAAEITPTEIGALVHALCAVLAGQRDRNPWRGPTGSVKSARATGHN